MPDSKKSKKMNPCWRPFEEARDYARSLGLKSRKQWLEFARGEMPELGQRPDDIPMRPLEAYKYHGWCGYYDWLGLPTRRWRYYSEARRFVSTLKFETLKEWKLYCKGDFSENCGVKPENIPTAPNTVYKDQGWISWGDFLGNGVIQVNGKIYEPFVQAREYVRSLNLNSQSEWFELCKDEDIESDEGLKIPRFPYAVYRKHGWTSWQDWLGLKGSYPTCGYEEAKEFVRKLKLKNNKEWKKYCRGELINRRPLPENIPATPDVVYQDQGWISWGEFLGTGNVGSIKRTFKSFEETREFARNLNLSGGSEWRKYCKGELSGFDPKPDDIPSNPNRSYRTTGWIFWGDFLGTGTVAGYNKVYRSFSKARKFARALNFKNAKEWRSYCVGGLPDKGIKPDDIPANPNTSYKNKGWKSWGDFLGTGTIAKYYIKFKSYEEARDFVQKLGIKTSIEWKEYVAGKLPDKTRPDDIPSCPDSTYKSKGWVSWGEFLGTGTVAVTRKEFKSFEEARKFVRSLKLKSAKEWQAYCKGELLLKGIRPDDIPTNPAATYKNEGWISFGDWLGTGRIASNKIPFRSFESAREFARSLNLRSAKEWAKYSKGKLPDKGSKPDDIPACPDASYKNKGWISWPNFLGNER